MSKVQLHSCILIVVLALGLVVTKLAKPTSADDVKTEFSRIPIEFNGWMGIQGEFDDQTKRLLPTASLLSRSYHNENIDSPVILAIVYGTDLEAFHQPEVCLEGQGFRSVRKSNVTIKPKNGIPFKAMSDVMESDSSRHVFLFWFTCEGVSSTDLGTFKLKMMKSQILSGKRIPAAMVRLSMDVTGTDEEAIEELSGFAETITPYLYDEFEATDRNFSLKK